MADSDNNSFRISEDNHSSNEQSQIETNPDSVSNTNMCTLCNQTFATDAALKNHHRNSHQDYVRLIYPNRKEILIRKIGLYFHCIQCEKVYGKPRNIQNHAKKCQISAGISSNSNPVTSIPVVPPPSVDPNTYDWV